MARYTVQFKSNVGSGVSGISPTVLYYHTGSVKYTTGTSSTGAMVTHVSVPTRQYFKFKGYYAIKAPVTGNETQYAESGGYLRAYGESAARPTADMTLYTWWTRICWPLTLDRQSGTGGTATLYGKTGTGGWCSDAECKSPVTSITPPTRTGYRFVGYYSQTGGAGTKYINADGSFTTDFELLILSAATTIYAHWLQIDEITIETTGHSVYYPDGKYLYYCDGAFYSDDAATTPITAINPPRVDSAVFLGCYLTDGTDGTQVIAPDGTISGSWAPSDGDTIYAQFRTVVEITLFPGTGGGDASIFYDSADSKFHREDGDGGITSVIPPQFECRRFMGYYTEMNGGGTKCIDADGTLLSPLTSNPPSTATTLYAYAPRVSYKILIDPQGGDGGPEGLYNDGSTTDLYPDDLCEEDPLVSVELPSLLGHVCTGLWSADSGGTKWVDADGSIVHSEVVSGDSTFLYAQWTPGTYVLHFDYAGGSGTPSMKYVTWGQAVGALPTVTPPRNTWTFKGWYVDGEKVTSSTVWKGEDAIAVAEWETPFGQVDDWFGMKSSSLIPVSSDSGDSQRHTNAVNGGRYSSGVSQTSGIWRNPTVTYAVVKNVTVAATLGKAFAATKSGGVMTISGYMITSVEVSTRLGSFPTVTVSATANEGVNAINQFGVSIPVKARARAQDMLDAISGGGFLHAMKVRACCDPVVCEEDMMPCASDVVRGRYELSAETLATNRESAPTAQAFHDANSKGGFTITATDRTGGGTEYVRYSVTGRREIA
ncbi:MAG: InlB B-repeat-containing protein [Kiritimatiellae bacterium]|nr:InlB B-repeat-containing protein [Kiritimatiellia bacterium]